METLSFLEENLLQNEEIIDKISPIEYKDTKFNCFITNLRIILQHDDLKFVNFFEIDRKTINSITLGKDSERVASLYVGIIYLSIGVFVLSLLFLNLNLITSLGLVVISMFSFLFLFGGAVLLIGYFIKPKNFLALNSLSEHYKLYATFYLLKRMLDLLNYH